MSWVMLSHFAKHPNEHTFHHLPLNGPPRCPHGSQEEAAKGLAPERPLFVDVGGGLGHMSIGLREALPDVPNRIIVQDQAPIIESAVKHPGVEFQVVVKEF